MQKRLFAILFVFCLACGLVAARAGETNWPRKSVEFIVPYSAGGDTDFNARCLAKYLTTELGKNVIITNITGGGSSIGMDEVHNSEPDGYRYLINHAPIHTTKAFGVLDYGYEGFDSVCVLGLGIGEFLAVRSDFPANNLKEFIEYSGKNPGTVKFGYNAGATSHYVAIKLQLAGAEMNMIPVGSAADRVIGLKGQHLDAVFAAMPILADYVTTGEFKILASYASKRHPAYPDIPTCLEQGVDISLDCDYGLYAAKGTDPAIIAKMAAAVEKVVTGNADYAAEIKRAYNQLPFFLGTKETEELMAVQQAAFMEISEELKSNY